MGTLSDNEIKYDKDRDNPHPSTRGLAGHSNQKPTTIRDITGNCDVNADPVDFSSGAANKASIKWEFRIRAVASPGQTVWMMEENKVVTKQVGCVRIHLTVPTSAVRAGFDHAVQYQLDNEWVSEHNVFSCKQDLLNSL